MATQQRPQAAAGAERWGRMRWPDRAVRPPRLLWGALRVYTVRAGKQRAIPVGAAGVGVPVGAARRRHLRRPRVRRTSAGWLAWVETEDGNAGPARRRFSETGRARSDDVTRPVTLYVYFCDDGFCGSPLVPSFAFPLRLVKRLLVSSFLRSSLARLASPLSRFIWVCGVASDS